jgi:hypothetical protein
MLLDQLPILDKIPPPADIRQRLVQLTREQALLRSLLRVSERKQDALERERIQSGGKNDAA